MNSIVKQKFDSLAHLAFSHCIHGYPDSGIVNIGINKERDTRDL